MIRSIQHQTVYRSMLAWMVFYALVVVGIVAYRERWEDKLDDANEFMAPTTTIRISHVRSANVSVEADMAMFGSVPNPCHDPYGVICNRWKHGSYLLDNAVLIHEKRVANAITNATIHHELVGEVYRQCLSQMYHVHDNASLQYVRELLADCEPPAAVPAAERNLHRLACYEQASLFPALDWHNSSMDAAVAVVRLSGWVAPWPEFLFGEACAILAPLTSLDTANCVESVKVTHRALLNMAEEERRTLTGVQWNTLTAGRLHIPNSRVRVWSEMNLKYVLRLLESENAKHYLWAAVVGDLLPYVGMAGRPLNYYATELGMLARSQRLFPPSVYGWLPAGVGAILSPDGDDEIRAMESCVMAIGDVTPQEIDRIIFPPDDTIEHARLIFEELRAQYISEISATTMLSEQFKRFHLDRLETVAPLFGLNDDKQIAFHGATFVESMVIGRAFNRHDIMLHTPGDFHIETFNAKFMKNRNAIFIPTTLLLPPYFDPHSSTEAQLGRFGAIVGHEFAHDFATEVTNNAINSGSDFVKQSLSMRCYRDEDASFHEHETLPDILGFEAAYRVCVKLGGCNTPERRVLFMGVYGQTFCSGIAIDDADSHESPRNRVNMALHFARDAERRPLLDLWSCVEPPDCKLW